MEKQFQEVFPDLRIEGGMAELLDTVEVSRVSINKKKDLLRIYVVSHQWIHKKYIYQLERQIEEQLFSNVPLRVKIIERFYLSRQYTPENFLEVYRPSILLELKNHSVFLNHLFSTAEITFPETNKMHLVLVDSVVAKEREEFGRTQMPVKGPLRKRFQESAVALPRNYGYGPDIPFHCLPVRLISLGNIRIKPFCHQQKPVLPLHTQRYRIGGMEKTFIICGYSKLVK